MLLSYAFKGTEDDIHLYTRSDGKLFNMRRLQAKSKRRKISIKELLFADDAALVAHSESTLQALIDRLQDACEKFSLTISVKKTVVMAQGVKNPPVIKLNNTPLEVVSKFCYLGSTTIEGSTLDDEITQNWQQKPKWVFTRHVSSVHFCTAAKPGQATVTKKRNWTASIFAAYAAYSK